MSAREECLNGLINCSMWWVASIIVLSHPTTVRRQNGRAFQSICRVTPGSTFNWILTLGMEKVLNRMLFSCFTWPHSVASSASGLHHGHVLPPDVDWWAAEIRGTYWNIAAQQSHGGKDLGTGHILPKLQKINFSQHDHAEQTVPYYAERDGPLHYEVTSHLMLSWHRTEGKWLELFFPNWLSCYQADHQCRLPHEVSGLPNGRPRLPSPLRKL